MEAYAHRFYQGTHLWGKVASGDDLLPRQYDILHHGTVALNTQCLVMLAGVDTTVAAGGTLATVGIGIAGHHHARLQGVRNTSTYGLDDSTHLMTGDDRIECHAVTTHEGIDITTTEAHIVQLQQHLALTRSLGLF